MKVHKINFYAALLLLAASCCAPLSAVGDISVTVARPTAAEIPAVTISGGDENQRKYLASCFEHQLHGLTVASHPLTISIVPLAEMRKLVASGSPDTDSSDGGAREALPDAPVDNGQSIVPPVTAAAPNESPDDGVVDGIYTDELVQHGILAEADRTNACITLLKGEPMDDFSETFFHEYGHHLWSAALTPQERSVFKRLYKQAASAQLFVSDYASVSAEEDFAESFAYSERAPKILSERDPSSAAYMTALVARIRADNKAEAVNDARVVSINPK